MYNDVITWLGAGYIADVVLFYFSKAFDVVNHSLLLDKLRVLGVHDPLLSWISDFLLGHTMQVSVSRGTSSSKDILSGVSQGSILGPLCSWYISTSYHYMINLNANSSMMT